MDYPSYEFLVELHVYLMREVWKETYYGPTRPELLQSALARPWQAAYYEAADGIRQAAYLFQGILMNHGFAQGNKRTAYALTEWFLRQNHLGVIAAGDEAVVAFCLAAENEKWSVDQIEAWLRTNIQPAQDADADSD
jgi:death-on-curing protein